MDKSKLSFLLLILLISNLFGQGMWEPAGDYDDWSSPKNMFFIDSYEGWIISRELFNTRNEGQSWIHFDVLNDPTDIDFINHETGWASANGYLYHTTDGGDNWERGDHVGVDFPKLCFVSRQTGWTSGLTVSIGPGGEAPPPAGIIGVTRDGGHNWSLQYLERNARGGFSDISFADEAHGIVNYNGNTILLTENGGEDWEVIGNLPCSIREIEHLSEGTFIGLGYFDIARTTDFGHQWEIVWNGDDNGDETRVNEVSFANAEVGFISGSSEGIPFMLCTEDGGLNWEEFPVPDPLQEDGGEIRSISFPTPWRGYASVYRERELSGIYVWTDTEQTVRLNIDEGWNMVSVNVDPSERAVDEVVRSLVRSETLTIMKDSFGHFYLPEREFNNIPSPWTIPQGYMIRVERDIHLTIAGERIAPNTPVELSEGWQMVAYYPRESLEAPQALESIQNDLLTAKDDNGRFYLPEFNFNNMPPMEEGSGYLLKMENEAELIYPDGE